MDHVYADLKRKLEAKLCSSIEPTAFIFKQSIQIHRIGSLSKLRWDCH